MPGVLYLVALPIGNLADITHRALETLRSVDAILAEDTRNTKRLLRHFDVETPFFSSLYQGVEERRIERIVGFLDEGKSLALVSDAGTPLISDPGFPLVREAVARGIQIVPIPGATAAVAALIASGLPTDRFVFEGSVPRKREGRNSLLDRIEGEQRTVVVYESPHRITDTLRAIAERLPAHPMVVGRELTKIHEEFLRGTAGEILDCLEARDGIRGEFVLVISGCPESSDTYDAQAARMLASRLVREGVSGKTILELLTSVLSVPRNEAYALVQEARNDKP